MTDQPTPPGSTPTPTHPPSAKQAAPGKKVASGKKVAPGKRTAPVSKAEARTAKPSTETNKDRAIHLDIGPVEIDIPRTLGYYGGIGAHTSGLGNPTGDAGPRGIGLDHAFLIMLVPLIVSGLLLLLLARRTYPRDVATAIASENATRTAHE